MRNQRGFLPGVFVLLSLAGLSTPVQAGSASLLDLASGEVFSRQVRVASPFFSLGKVALVLMDEASSGQEIWVTDGTENGTRPLLDLCPGSCSSSFTPLGTIGQVGIFLGPTDGEWRLWRSDGTRPGTFPLTASSGEELDTCFSSAASVGPFLLFAARVAGGKCELWRTDGTRTGTLKVAAMTILNYTPAGDQVFLGVQGETGRELWRSDGTPDGTIRLRTGQNGWSAANFAAVGSRLFFTAQEDGRELWTSDGTVAGTLPLTRFSAAEPFFPRSTNSPSEIVFEEAGGSACFLANDGNGREMWCSDGTPAGTRQATSLAPASPFVELSAWRVERFGGRLLFPANDGLSGNRWWTSDGRPESTAPLTGCPGGCPVLAVSYRLVRVGTQVFFAALGEGPFDPEEPPTTDLWVTDGTGPGTRRVGDLCDRCHVGRMYPLLGKLLFLAGREIFHDVWSSDGTPEGTRLLLPLRGLAEGILPYPPAAVNGRGLVAQQTLWVSDGTPAGTEEVTFLGQSDRGSNPSSLVPTLDGIRFTDSSENGGHLWESRGTAATTAVIETPLGSDELTALGSLTLMITSFEGVLGRTDGTPAGTFQLTPEGLEAGRPVIVGSRALFVGKGQGAPTAFLWATDGTVAGTGPIAELPGERAGIFPAGSLALISMGDVLWRTDGTPAGTREIFLPEEFRSFNGGDVAQLGSALFFRGYAWEGQKLWRSDGTPGGTRPFADAVLGGPGSFIAHAGALYILAHTEASGLNESGLFRSDGTDAGTVLLATVPNSTTALPEFAQLTPVGNLVFFFLEDGRGRELWRSDGTPAGTFLVRDIVPGKSSSWPDHLTALEGRLYFTASSIGSGTELWESDGTKEGTRVVQDIQPGALSSDPEELTAGGGRLFFTADDGVHGRELWVYTPGGEACVPSERALCLGGGRFKVEADWRGFNEESGWGRAVSLTPDTGYFWFFDPANVEVILKALDGQGVNGHHWVFYGALSSVEYILTVTDTQTGAVRRYVNPPGRLGSVADTIAFGPLGATVAETVKEGPEPRIGEPLVTTRTAPATGSCAPSSTRLCLNGGRFAVEARWKDFAGHIGAGQAVPLPGGDTGYFWFFDEANVEVVLKVLDGSALNGKFWVFYGALSTVEYTLTVTDTLTGVVKVYTNPSGRLASVADTAAF
jgi:ELWxxDGT repeat protein